VNGYDKSFAQNRSLMFFGQKIHPLNFDPTDAPAMVDDAVERGPMRFVEISLPGPGGVARGAGVVRNGDSTTRLGALYNPYPAAAAPAPRAGLPRTAHDPGSPG
jgi:hypothetical protein